jgi:HJR/Mrr/RecB family endonuclease
MGCFIFLLIIIIIILVQFPPLGFTVLGSLILYIFIKIYQNKRFKSAYGKKLKKLSTNKKIKNITYNYVKNTDENIFLDKEKYIEFDSIINQVKNSNKLKEKVHGNDDIKAFLNLLELLQSEKQIDKQNKLSIYLSWSLIKLAAIEYFSEIFEKKCNDHFKSIKNMPIETCIKRYILIDTIDNSSNYWLSIFTYYLMKHNKIESSNFDYSFILVSEKFVIAVENNNREKFKKTLLKEKDNSKTSMSMDDIDLMSGEEFENFLNQLFSKMGYSTTQTSLTRDQGIDLIAKKNGNRIGIQAKCYSGLVSNKAIQEVVAGLKFYDLQKGLVITNNRFTKSAIQLAKANDVLLWDRDILNEKLLEAY